jgi:hypothetical protein
MWINLSARRFFLQSWPRQWGRKRKLIQGFERDAAIRMVHTKSQLACKPCSVPGAASPTDRYPGKAKPCPGLYVDGGLISAFKRIAGE